VPRSKSAWRYTSTPIRLHGITLSLPSFFTGSFQGLRFYEWTTEKGSNWNKQKVNFGDVYE